ncbi:MAG TPA: hypothetical protein PK733_18670, partial [Clostridiales bacterium]|nr:hypothetical protein [Clostridiales bacterium]
MDAKSFKGNRWIIISGKYEGVEKYAVDELYKLVQQHVPYILTVYAGSTASEGLKDELKEDLREDLREGLKSDLKNYNIIFIGTEESNEYIAGLLKDGIIRLNKDDDT